MLKQRLVGAAVIIALAVVLIPMILDGAGKHLVPNIPHEPSYLKTHVRQNMNVASHNRSATKNISNNKFKVIAIPVRNSQPVKAMSRLVASPQLLNGTHTKFAQVNNNFRTHSQISSEIKKSYGSVKVAKVSSSTLSRSSFVSLRRNPKTINSRPNKRRSIYSAIKVWSVQIASFKSPGNARTLKRKLNKAGFKAYILQTRPSKRQQAVYRVRIGPEKSHSNAKAILARLREKIRLNGYITGHKK